jgi:hypothetical protein
MLAFIVRIILCDQSFDARQSEHITARGGTATVVDPALVFLEHRVAHLIEGGAKLQRIGCLQPGMRSAPEQNAADKPDHKQGEL